MRMDRVQRRHHKARFKRKAKRLYPGQNPGYLGDILTPCSCFMCGNPRKFTGELTMQEKKANEAFNLRMNYGQRHKN